MTACHAAAVPNSSTVMSHNSIAATAPATTGMARAAMRASPNSGVRALMAKG